MRQTNTRTVAEQKPIGVIDAVSAGLQLVWRRPWTLIVPVVLDLLIWVLPRLSLTQLFRPYANEMFNAAALTSDPQTAEDTRAAIQQMLDSFNLLGLVATALNAVTRLPTLLGVGGSTVVSPITSWAYTYQLNDVTPVLILFIPLFFLGLLAVSLYLEWIAQGARPLENPVPGAAVMRIARLWLRLILFSLLLILFLFAAGMVIVLMQMLFNSPEVAGFAALLLTVALFWVVIYFFFVPSALAVSDIGIRNALRRSTLLFRLFFWSTLALVALSVFLDRGLAIIWDGLTVSPLGIGLAIVANAFIGTALIAASMVYYQDRMSILERIRASHQVKTVKK